jgi:glycosyltransferase involved in cell wall biosynthesis
MNRFAEPPESLLASLVAALARPLLRAVNGARAVVASLLLLPLLWLRPGIFDRRFYRDRYGFSRLVRLSPLLEFSFRGARALRDPSSRFSQSAYGAAMPWTIGYPPILHALLHGSGTMTEPDETPPEALIESVSVEAALVVPVEVTPVLTAVPFETPLTPKRRLEQLWPMLRADMVGLQDVANALTPNDRLYGQLLHRCHPAPMLQSARVAQRLMARMPDRVEHLVVVPWLGVAGGSEQVTQRLLKRLSEHYTDGGLCVLAPDAVFDLGEEAQRSFGVPIVAINDIDRTLGDAARVELLDRVLVELRPRTVHSVNSDTAWQAFRDHGRHYARDCRLYGNIYSDFRYPDGTPMGVFWRYLSDTLPHMAGIVADNRKVISRAEECFSLLPEEMARFFVLPTPILGVAEERCREFRPGRGKHSLWMSRIAREKRMEVLRDVAMRCPDREFSIYGNILPNTVPDDYLDWVKQSPNVRHWGRFEALSTLPIDEYDSYIFTSSGEGMPISLLEATMLGMPTVAPDVGGISEFIDNGTGWLVSGPDDVDGYVAALAAIERDPAEAGRRVRAAQERLLQRHSWANFCRCLADIPGYLRPGDN